MAKVPASMEPDADGEVATMGAERDSTPEPRDAAGRSWQANMDARRATNARLGGRKR